MYAASGAMLIILIPLLWKLPWIVVFYTPIYWLLKWLKPNRSFVVKISDIDKAIIPTDEEWELERNHDEEVLTIEGSTKEGNVVYVQVLTRKRRNFAFVAVVEDGVLYQNSFSAPGNADNRTISVGPLNLELRWPFRTWRVSFRGYANDPEGRPHFVSVGGWWKSLSASRFFYSNMGLGPMAELLRRNKLGVRNNVKLIEKFRTAKAITQLGELFAEVRIDEKVVEHKYRGSRERVPIGLFDTTEQLSICLEDGNSITHKQVSFENHTMGLEHGMLFKSNRLVRAIKLKQADSLDASNLIPLEFVVRSETPTFEVRKDEVLQSFSFVRPDNKVVEVNVVKVVRALSHGIAFVSKVRETLHDVDAAQLSENELFAPYTAIGAERQRHVLPFSHRACQDKSLCGGKGANLACLQTVTNGFRVPPGLVVTTAAFDAHVARHADLGKLIHQLDFSARDIDKNVEIGHKIESELTASRVSEALIDEILAELPESEYYAVRSSAVGEDGVDLSCAGQLESYLDVTKDEIAEKLKLCWASNFRKEVINYRRNYGQALNPSMAVVVQEMSRNGVAGVMFTEDPVNRDPGRLLINALKGSGEQIVGGQETPDEIHVHRIFNQISKPDDCCLSDTDIGRLRAVGEHLEVTFGRPQDIEFVARNGVVFIVQSRDITGLDKETNFELYYEFDNPSFTDKEILTNANVGEVVPHPICPFEATSLIPIYDKTLLAMTNAELDDHVPVQYGICFIVHHRKIFLNAGDMFLRSWEQFSKDRLSDYVIGGEKLFDQEMFAMGEQRYGKIGALGPIKNMIRMLSVVYYRSYKSLKAVKKSSEGAEALVIHGDVDVDVLIRAYEKQAMYLQQTLLNHGTMSIFSSFTYVVVGMLIRGSERGDLSADVLSDIATVFSNNSRSDVISADVPNSLKKIARAIRQDNLAEEFKKHNGKDALAQLQSGAVSGPLLKSFLEQHGHRGPKELYYDAITWGEDVDLLVHTLKGMLTAPEMMDKVIENEQDIIDTLKCKPKGIRRVMLKYFISQTHRGVAYRETAKNYLVKATDATRKTIRAIGQKLYTRGYLPDPNLWKFLTIDEIKELDATRSAKIISRALRRQKIAPKFEGLQFPLIFVGDINPLNTQEELAPSNKSVTLGGTTVCEGVVVARARVVRTLEEARDTQAGEILITRYTDICWSPFFPLIKGLVTEIGGLLSHGAVVAREYGLPSLIAVKNATAVFKTGDLVELNASKGTISRVETEPS